ncbi:hypothetical protein [Nonomuraea rubra]|uniref:Uncharacterized protein n=1 Tax=Nonomuraea rubra TaxID=46180 RepID=A0A7X0P6M8_9ACTN|nr:hypothetical protein [Nonomuraea rubra]MBB6556250.1 hypothetical protein [Nonomuraea rubra]
MTAPAMGRWLKVNTVITRVWAETGHLLGMDDVLRLGKQRGWRGLVVQHDHECTRVLEQSVTDHVAWLLTVRASIRKAGRRAPKNKGDDA